MGTQTTQLEGPDLKLGVSVSDLADGQKLVGHVDGEAVLLVKTGGRFFAVGANCTHYGAPLQDGIVVGDEIRCPWHHAAFCLKDGTAARAPALNPISCWDVELRDGRLYVQSKHSPAPSPSQTTPLKKAVIIGAGAAGNAAAEMLRRQGYQGSLVMVGADPSVPYDRPNLSKDFLAGSAPEEWIPLRSPEFYRDQDIDLRLGVRATGIDPAARLVSLNQGDPVAYDACLLATGATPIRLPVPGSDLPHVAYLRTLDDCRAIIARIPGARRAAVVGSGFIGLEVASALRARGLEVAVISRDALPLERVVGAEVGRFLLGLHETNGVSFHLERTLQSIEPQAVVLDNGARVDADLVIIGIGVKPDTQLAAAAGLKVEGGVVVNEYLETDQPGIFAAGDIASWRSPDDAGHRRVEHWVVAERQGQTAALNMLGQKVAFTGVPFFWTAHYGVTLSYVGHASSWDNIQVHGDLAKQDAAVALLKGNRIEAIITIGRDQLSLEAEAAMERDDQQTLRKIIAL